MAGIETAADKKARDFYRDANLVPLLRAKAKAMKQSNEPAE
jgi:hypothetical protein